MEQLAGEYAGRVKFVQVDTPKNLKLAQRFRIQAIPTLVFFKGGTPQSQLVGLKDKQAIQTQVDSLL